MTLTSGRCKLFGLVRCHSLSFRGSPVRLSNTLANEVLEKHRKSELSIDKEENEVPMPSAPREFRYVYPDFLPEPDWRKRDRIREKLERLDMYRRRSVMQIPEFYVGSILAVTASDTNAPTKKNRFVGICIQRGGHGLRSFFTLRNHVDGQGVEIMYEMYSPTIQKIEILKLEKRLDEELLYLRDAPADYSTIPFNMDRVPHPPGAAVPLNTSKVKLGPRPWYARWERYDLQGVEDLGLPEKFYKRAEELAKPWEKYDIMRKYRKSINEHDANIVMSEVQQNVKNISRSKERQKRSFGRKS